MSNSWRGMPKTMASVTAVSDRHELAASYARYDGERHPDDRDALVEGFLPLAYSLARRYSAPGERDDLDQVACLGLIKAVDRFDPARGVAFTSFAVPTILGELKRYFRDQGWAVRVPRSLKELAARVSAAVEELSGELGRSPTTEEIAARCGESVERVLEARATATAHRPDSLDQPEPERGDEPAVSAVGFEEPGYARVERRVDVERMLSGLSEREEMIVRMRFEEDL